MGFAMVSAEAPVTKTSSSILAFKEDIVSKAWRRHVSTVQDALMSVRVVLYLHD